MRTLTTEEAEAVSGGGVNLFCTAFGAGVGLATGGLSAGFGTALGVFAGVGCDVMTDASGFSSSGSLGSISDIVAP